jgi:hypothetical protein
MPRQSRGGDANNLASERLKAGGRTYFFDIKEASSGRPYLAVTETRFDKRTGERTRSGIICYPEDVEACAKLFQDFVDQLTALAGDGEAPERRRPSFGVGTKRATSRQQSFDDLYEEDAGEEDR